MKRIHRLRPRSRKAAAAVLLALGASFAAPAHAVDRFWNGTGGNDFWSTTGNWSGGNIPGVGDRAIFNDVVAVPGQTEVNLGGVTRTVDSVIFQGALGYLPLNGTLALTQGDVDVEDPALHLMIANVRIQDDGVWDVKTDASLLVSGAISNSGGSHSLTKNGGGLLQFTGSGAGFQGNINVNSGTLEISTRSLLRSGNNVLVNGTLNVNQTAAVGNATYSDDFSGTGTLVKSGSATLTLTGDNRDFDGNVTVAGGTLAIDAFANLVNPISTDNMVTVNSGATLRFESIGGIGGLTGSGNVETTNHTLGIEINSGVTEFSGSISGSGFPFKDGPGTLRLTGNSTLTESFSVFEGTLVAVGDALPASLNIAPAFGGIFEFEQNTGNRTHTGEIDGFGEVHKSGNGTVTLTHDNPELGGPTTIHAGTLILSNPNSLGVATELGPRLATLGTDRTGSSHVALLSNTAGAIPNAITVASDGTGSATIGSTNFSSAGSSGFAGTITLNRDVILQAGNTDRTTIHGRITGTGGVTITSPFAAGRRIVFDRPSGAANSFSGDVTIGANAVLQLGVVSSIGNRTIPDGAMITFADATSQLRLAPNNNVDFETVGTLVSSDIGHGSVSMTTGTAFTLSIGADGEDGEFSGFIQDSTRDLTIEKVGEGTQTLSGNNSYSGGTTVSAGKLVVNTNALPGNVTNNAILEFNQTFDGTYAGVISGSGTLIKEGNAKLTLTADSSGFTGGITVADGTLQVGGDDNLPVNLLGNFTTVTVDAGATLRIDGDGERIGGLAGFGDVELVNDLGVGDNGNRTFSGSLSGAGTFGKVGATTMILDGDSHLFEGDIIVFSGTLQIGGNNDIFVNTLGTSTTITVNSDAVLVIDGDGEGFGGLAGEGDVELKNNIFVGTDGDDMTENSFSGLISGTGGLFKQGPTTMILSGNNTYTGGTEVEAGTLIVANTTGSATGTGAVTVKDGGTLSGTGTIAGAVTVQDGGAVTPGTSAGELAFDDDLTMDAGSTLEIELGGLTVGTEYDQLDVGGTANLGGTLEISLIDGFVPAINDLFSILTANTIVGRFDDVIGATVAPGVTLIPQYAFGVTLRAAQPGDANFDGSVDVADLGILSFNFGDTDSEWEQADFNFDGITDVADLGILGANWSDSQMLAFEDALRVTGLGALVPEPSVATVLLVGLLFGRSRCRWA